jgi:hypothetical protein
MLSNWVRFYLKFCTRFSLITLLFFSSHAQAVITIQPANGGTPPILTTGGGGTYQYFVSYPSSPPVTPPDFINFTPLNISLNGTTDPGYANMFQVTITSNQTINITGGQQPVITMTAAVGSGTAQPAPIAAVNGVSCYDSTIGNGNCVAQNQVVTMPLSNHFYAAKYLGSNASVTIGFYLSEICSDAKSVGAQITGCNSTPTPNTLPVYPVAGTPQTIQLNFSISMSANNGSATPATGAAIDSTTSPTNFTTTVDSHQLNCPTQSVLNTSYLPGDGQIFLNSSLFGITSATSSPSTMYVVGNVGKDPYVKDIGFLSSANNSVVSTAGLGMANAPVTGFTNSVSGAPQNYNISFIMVDPAGIYVPPASASACEIQGVQTAAIQGFLKPGSKNCFIATAAFGSAESLPVQLLREFRDRFLFRFEAGQHFVKWYYDWSPAAANWLQENSIFRFPVLLFLLPLELVAWLCLHPVWVMALIVAASLESLFLVFMLWRRRETE